MTANLDGLNPILAQQIGGLIKASQGQVYLASGYRGVAQQEALYNKAAQQFGPSNANTWVADPQHSNHVHGRAADLGGDLGVIGQLAPQFGLIAPMPWEPWHMEMSSTHKLAAPLAYTTPPPGEVNPTQADFSQKPAVVAATLAEGLLGAHQTGDLPSFTDVIQPQPQTPQNQQPAGGASGTSYVPGGGAFGGVQNVQWAHDFLTALGAPITGENMRAITAWEMAESGGGGGHFNPLNTTQGGFAGETDYNSVGVKNYTSYDDGIQANVKVINNGLYQPILDALKAGNNAMSVAQAISQTPWGTGGLVAKILGGG